MADPELLDAFLGKLVGDLGAAVTAALVVVGDKLGLYRALAEGGPQSPEELAARAGADARYLREWLCAQAAAGYVNYTPANGRFWLDEIQRATFTDETSPAFFLGGFQIVDSIFKDEPKLLEAFRSGRGVGWHEHHASLFQGTERFFRPGYNANLTSAWIPALDGVEEKLNAGASVADVGCGHGASTLVMAKAFPRSRFVGFDYHDASIERARALARAEGLGDRVRFEVAPAQTYPGDSYDLVAFFDCLHDMGDPLGAARNVRRSLAPDGTWLLVEPMAGDRVEDNLNPVGRVFYAASTMICTPAARSQEGGFALGAQAGEARLRALLEQAGFGRIRRAAETPFNLVLEVRP
jgi:SAM-dependent methyltransferase